MMRLHLTVNPKPSIPLAWILLAFILALASPILRAAPDTRPNFILLFADDQRADTIGAWGNRHIRTPNLDRLTRQGFSFRRNYCFGSDSS
jgi:Sulfatase